ncbi:MAG: acetyltransferase [Gammaproteobacteria bacterium]|nr:acetyltransferase [Gammaproteobacteria bacterium]
MTDRELRLAQFIRDACLESAAVAYNDAKMSGLCEEGGIEAALDSIRSIDIEALISMSEGKLPDNE